MSLENNIVPDKLKSISESVSEKQPVDLDHALSVAGFGKYNIKYCFVLALSLVAAIVEPLGYSYILPSSKCDLGMTDAQRGFIASIPYLAVVVTSFPWGYLVDTRGRKLMIIYSSLATGIFGILAGFMPDLISFTALKLLASLCLACPAAAPYSFIGEIVPQKYRDLTLSITNATQILGSALVPLIAWGILPLEFSKDFGSYYFRPWRLLAMVYSCSFLVVAALLSFGPESPKYLLSKGKHDESLQVLTAIFVGNTGKSPEDYPVKALKMVENAQTEKIDFITSLKVQTVPLLKPPYLKWLVLNGVLLFGVFASLNGLYMWLPDVLNRVITQGGQGLTACDVINQRLNETTVVEVCDDTIGRMTFLINAIATICCSIIALGASVMVKFIGKKALLLSVFGIIGIFVILVNFVKQDILFAVLLSSITLTGLAIGPINAYGVQIFPTNLRGMAISLGMMIGRSGSVIGSNVAGVLLSANCEVTFYLFGGSLLLCGLLSLLLPRSTSKPPVKNVLSTHL